MRSLISLSFLLSCLLVACGGGGAQVKAGPMPENGTFSGVYYSPQYGEMNMIQNGSAVVGEYKQDLRSGKIQGEADGDLLRFEWTESKAMVGNRPTITRGHGYFRFLIDKSNGQNVIKGEWGLGDDETGGGGWNAYKAKNKEPHLSSETSGGDSESGDEGDSTGSESGGSSGGDDKSTDSDLF